MANSCFSQFRLLLWKNWVLQKRRKVLTVFQILLPAAFAIILLLIRMRVKSNFVADPTIWESFRADTTLPGNLTIPPRISVFDRRWRLAFSPNLPIVQRLVNATAIRMDDATKAVNPITNVGVIVGKGFSSEAELETFFNDQNPSITTLCGIVFDADSMDSSGGSLNGNAKITYKIRLRAEGYDNTYKVQSSVSTTSTSSLWQTNSMYGRQLTPKPRGDMYGGPTPDYYNEGFLAIQRAVDLSIIDELSGGKMSSSGIDDKIDVRLKTFPYPPYLDDAFIFILTTQFPFIIMLSFIVTAPTICKDVVLEKEKKLKESMKLMGLKVWLHWMSWFVKFAIFMLISVAIMTFFFHIKLGGRSVITYTNPGITFIFLLLYSLSVVMFCFAISTFFSKASAGAAAGGIIYLGTYVPYFFMGSSDRYASLTASTKIGSSILCNLAMAIGCQTIASFESTGTGVQWSTINKPVSVDDNFAMSYVFLMLIFDIFFYALITWYFDALLPGDFGTPQPFYFPFTKWYWCGRSANAVDCDRENCGENIDYGDKKDFFEAAPRNDKVGIRIRSLTKKFNKTQRPAVNNLSIDMYEGHITALLGHNGAGKTTTMFMLTGFLPPTNGTAIINGYDLRTDLTKIRENLGLCPQHDILFDTMTVEEHLIFFARLKGCPPSQLTAEVDNMIKVLHLEDKRQVASAKLSGGMKRKLSVGIALIAGSKFVILDEPSSGMDPEARRQVWDILQGQRAGRTMILSTHFMDEADLLGDRIAIMADGQLQCCGSSLFLKGKYGIGYHLTVVKSPTCNSDRVFERIRSHVPETQLESNVGAELSFILPKEKSSQFEPLFRDLEDNRKELGIDSFGASVTTLEEVFIKVGELSDNGLQNNAPNGDTGDKTNLLDANATPTTLSAATSTKSLTGVSVEGGRSRDDELFGVRFGRVSGIHLYFQQFYALLIKHLIHSQRNIVLTIVQIALPVIFTIFACLIEKAIVGPTDPPALSLNLTHFNEPVVVRSNGSLLTTDARTLLSDYGTIAGAWGTAVSSEQNMDDYLLDQANNLDRFKRHYLIAGTVSMSSTGGSSGGGSSMTSIIGHFNNIALHTIAMSLSAVDNALMQYVAAKAGSSRLGSGSSIETINHPLPRSLNTKTNDAVNSAALTGFTFSYLVSFGMAFMVSTFVVFVVNERSMKAKHAQFMTGIGATNFWLSSFLWDALCYLIPSVIIIIIVLAFQTSAYSTKDLIGIVFFDLILYGWSVIPFAYLISWLFNVASTAYTWILIINLFTGTIAVLAVYILKIPQLGTVDVGNGLEWFFYLILPNFCFNKALQDVYSNYQYGTICRSIDTYVNRTTFCKLMAASNSSNPCCPDACGSQCALTNDNYLSWEAPGIGRSLVFMFLQGAAFFLILFFLESSTIQRAMSALTGRESTVPLAVSVNADGTQQVVQLSEIGSPGQVVEDDDVRAERQRISRMPTADLVRTDKVILQELTKFYNGTFLAVDRLALGIPDGECFGLLGVNGAGKTTTFKMLTGDETLSAGEATLDGISVRQNVQAARERVGYCPQFDALIDQMTVTETLWMYARLRGVAEGDIKNLVEKMIEQLTLSKHAVKQAKNLSGGNRRKLSTGIALIGNPSIVFLDEPTTGMDPVARRLLWNTLSAIRSSGRTLILTSHSMEECEALCTRMAIMVNGRFQCLGSTQHLKAKFGEGYSLIMKLRQNSNVPDVQPGSSVDRRASFKRSNSAGVRAASVSSSSDEQDFGRGRLAQQQQMDTKMRKVMDFVKNRFPGSQLKDQHDGLLHYRILPDSGISANPDSKRPQQQQLSWAYVFGEIERAKNELDIEDYSVSQTTLEQVFINFARMQRPPQEMEQTTCCGCHCFCSCCRN